MKCLNCDRSLIRENVKTQVNTLTEGFQLVVVVVCPGCFLTWTKIIYIDVVFIKELIVKVGKKGGE